MVREHPSLDGFTIVIYILISVLVAFLQKKKGFFGTKIFF
jgi:hypothetical protein